MVVCFNRGSNELPYMWAGIFLYTLFIALDVRLSSLSFSKFQSLEEYVSCSPIYLAVLQVCVGLDWMVFHDTLQQYIAHTQNYIFLAYLPFLSVAFHFLFASPSKPYVRYPHTNFEVRSCMLLTVLLVQH